MNIYLQQQFKKPFFGRFFVKNWQNPLSFSQQTQWKEVNFMNPDGFILKGLFAPCYTAFAKASILLVPPMLKSAKGYFLTHGHTEVLRKNGYNVFVIDLNGFGESQNGSFDFAADILAASQTLEELTPDIPLGYLGVSQGAAWGICAMSDATHRFRTAIFESPLTSLPEFWKHYPLASKVLTVMKLINPSMEKRMRPILHFSRLEYLEKSLLIFAQHDIYTPVEMGKRFELAANRPTELVIFPNSVHLEPVKKYQQVYFDKIIAHFDSIFIGASSVKEKAVELTLH